MTIEEHLEYLEYLKYLAKTEPKEIPKRRIGAFDFGKYKTASELAEIYRDKCIEKGWIEK